MTQLSKHNAKEMLRRDLVKYGVSDFASLRKLMPPYMHYAFEENVMSRWAAGMDRGPRFEKPPQQPRLVNRFMLGADPEFVFATPFGENQRIIAADRGVEVVRQRVGTGYIASVTASSVGLKTGLAFGADQNGRLVELRVRPSRFALDVLGSTLDTLRWLRAVVGDVGMWIAGAWQFEDGLGGHVHFGRKRNLIPTEAAALDYVMEHLLSLGVFPQDEHTRRTAGDRRGQVYGRYYRDDPVHAVRRQQHGYEYRTYPSWLDSPQQAYLTLVLSKLVCHDPGLMGNTGVQKQFEQRVFNILRFYQGRDDDAAICLAMLRRSGFPRHIGGDFKPRWGLDGVATATEEYIIPRAIAASKNTIAELLGLLANGTHLGSTLPAPTWEPSKLPADGRWAMAGLETRGNPGMGEILADLVSSRRFSVTIYRSEGSWLDIDSKLAKQLSSDWKKKLRAILPLRAGITVRDSHNGIGLGVMLRDDPALAKRVLTSGVFPVWKTKDFKATSLDEWRAAQIKVGAREKVSDVPVGKGKLLHDLRA